MDHPLSAAGTVLGSLALGAAVGLGAVVAYQSVMWRRYVGYFRHKGEALPEPPHPRPWVMAREVAALLTVGWWHVIGLRGDARRAPEGAERGPPVLCVHGFMQDGTNWVGLRRHLASRGRTTEAVSMGLAPREQDDYADVLEARLAGLLEHVEGPVDVVAHSMGGIVLRRVLHRRPDLARRLRRVVTIASPHVGTAATRGISHLPETRAMARRGDYLVELPCLTELVPNAVVTTLGSPDDTTVYPVESTRLQGAKNLELGGYGHFGLMVWWEPTAHVLAALEG